MSSLDVTSLWDIKRERDREGGREGGEGGIDVLGYMYFNYKVSSFNVTSLWDIKTALHVALPRTRKS